MRMSSPMLLIAGLRRSISSNIRHYSAIVASISLAVALLTLGSLGAAAPAFAAATPAEDAAPDVVGRIQIYRAKHSDTLPDLARRFNLGFVELSAANPQVNVWLPGEGTRILIPAAHLLPDAPRKGIVINIPEMRLFHYDDDGNLLSTHPIGIGREGRDTPLGPTKIARKQANPTWYPPESIRAEKPELPKVVPPGPDNPLGTHALYLGWSAYLIHGTNAPLGIGRRVSSGCIRMYPEDIESLFPTVPVGTPVTVVDQPIKFGWIDGELFIEAHPTIEQADEVERRDSMSPSKPDDLTTQVEAAAGEQLARVDWRAVHRVVRERRGYPVRISRPAGDGLTQPSGAAVSRLTPETTIFPKREFGQY